MIRTTRAIFAMLPIFLAGTAIAEPIHVQAAMSPKQQIQLKFNDGTEHFFLMVQREGSAKGDGLLSGARVTEYGAHDITPGIGGNPRGYLVFANSVGDETYLRWNVQATFVPGPDSKPKLLDNGVWEIAGGTGKFKGAKGAGILHIKAISPTDRLFDLEGDIILAP